MLRDQTFGRVRSRVRVIRQAVYCAFFGTTKTAPVIERWSIARPAIHQAAVIARYLNSSFADAVMPVMFGTAFEISASPARRATGYGRCMRCAIRLPIRRATNQRIWWWRVVRYIRFIIVTRKIKRRTGQPAGNVRAGVAAYELYEHKWRSGTFVR